MHVQTALEMTYWHSVGYTSKLTSAVKTVDAARGLKKSDKVN